MNDNGFRFLGILIVLIGASISIYYRSKADRENGGRVSMRAEGMGMILALRLIGLAG